MDTPQSMKACPPETMAKKRAQIKLVLALVSEYWNAVGRPISMTLLSRRFGKSLSKLGGFSEVIDELKIEGALDIALNTKTGGKAVFPGGECLKLPLDYVLLK